MTTSENNIPIPLVTKKTTLEIQTEEILESVAELIAAEELDSCHLIDEE